MRKKKKGLKKVKKNPTKNLARSRSHIPEKSKNYENKKSCQKKTTKFSKNPCEISFLVFPKFSKNLPAHVWESEVSTPGQKRPVLY
jgi:hypothetical protein